MPTHYSKTDLAQLIRLTLHMRIDGRLNYPEAMNIMRGVSDALQGSESFLRREIRRLARQGVYLPPPGCSRIPAHPGLS